MSIMITDLLTKRILALSQSDGHFSEFYPQDGGKNQLAWTWNKITSLSPYVQGTKVCRYNWHSAGTLGWPFPMLKYKYIFK